MSPGAGPRVVLTLGKFDGVHRGHRALASACLRLARRLDARATALVIDPHPARVLAGARIPLLMTYPERATALAKAGIERVERLAFDCELAALGPEAFLDRLQSRFDLAGLVVGPDFAFGKDRSGDVTTLESLGARRGFELTVLPMVAAEGTRVASGEIRASIAEGDIARATRGLGHAPHLRGVVVAGARRGRALGYPTANLELRDDYVVPADGVYACRARWMDRLGSPQVAGAAASIGTRPTFDDGPRSIEVHLLAHAGDLYGLELHVSWLARLRGELRFDSVSDLLVAMAGDLARTKAVLARHPAHPGEAPGYDS